MRRSSTTAFAMIELLVAVGVLAVLTSIGIVMFGRASRRATLDTTAANIVVTIRLAQARAIAQQSGTEWGVRFEWPSGDRGFYAIFQGSSYTAASTTEKYYLPAQLQYSSFGEGSGDTVVFAKLTGAVLGASTNKDVSIRLPYEGLSKTVRIYPTGVVSIL